MEHSLDEPPAHTNFHEDGPGRPSGQTNVEKNISATTHLAAAKLKNKRGQPVSTKMYKGIRVPGSRA